MPDTIAADDTAPAAAPVPSRLRRNRNFSHGLSQAPTVKRIDPKGDAALLSCPRSAEGTCPYKRGYACREEIREYSLACGGVCAIERELRDQHVQGILEMLGCGGLLDSPSERLMDAARALAEAMLYMRRAQLFVGLLMTGELEEPTDPQDRHRATLRAISYQDLGVSAFLRRQNDVVAQRLWDLGFHPDRMREDLAKDGVTLHVWWQAAREEAKGKPVGEFLSGFRGRLPDRWSQSCTDGQDAPCPPATPFEV